LGSQYLCRSEEYQGAFKKLEKNFETEVDIDISHVHKDKSTNERSTLYREYSQRTLVAEKIPS
jgi:hypothetical protein